MSKHKDAADEPKPDAEPKAAPADPSRRMYRVKKSLGTGHEPGQLASHAELVGTDPTRPAADIDWLVRTGGIEAADHVHAAEATDADLQDEIEALHEELTEVRAELDAVKAQRASFHAAAVEAGVKLDPLPDEPAEGDEPPQPLGSKKRPRKSRK